MKNRLFYLLMLLLTMVTQGAWAMGELTGRFSVSESKEVCFSKGNLQAVIESGPTDGYNYTASKWKFAEHQWDYVGNNSGNSTFAAGTTVDLFGWVGESASYDTYGLCTLDHSQDEYFGNVANESLKSDWGKKMGEGWHTPTHEEWDYLFNTRPASTVGGTENGRYAMATVNSVSGVILFPDSYTHPDGVTAPASVNNPSASFNSNNYAGDNWDKMEAAGAVFLPFAGFRDNYYNTPFRVSESYYWSSSAYDSFSVSDAVYILTFSPNFLSVDSYVSRSIGCSVRLVKNAPLHTDDEGAYLISNANEWYTFCADVNTGTTYAGKTVKLTADVSGATHMAGTVDNPFAGTFDGQYHTLNVDITSSGTAAPFVRVGNATIRNLHVTGSVRTTMSDGADHTSGLISRTAGVVNIENVRVSATVTGLTYYSGFIGNGNRDDVSIGTTIKMTGCVFDGQLTENVAGETQHAGGFIGWGGNMTITMTDCLFAGTSTIAASGSGARNFHPVGFYGTYNTSLGSLTLNNVYTTAPSATQAFPNYGAALSSGEKQAYSITAADANVTTLANNGSVVTDYATSGLKRYDAGIMFGTTLYAGDSEEVKLALGHKAVEAGQHFTGYTVSGGGSFTEQTETSATLTMTAANQTISANYADNPAYEVVFADPSATAEGWSITPSGTVREGKTVTVSYQGEHKVKSVVVSRAFKKAADATATDLGKLICTDGHIHADDGNTEDPDCTKERVAIIAYVGSDNGESAPYNHGLALAMSDASEYSQWSTLFSKAHSYAPSNSNSFTSESGLQYNALHNTDIDDYPAFRVAIANNGTVTPTGCSSWFLASAYQWVKMAAGAGGYNQLGLVESVGYWSSTEYSDSHSAWLFKSGNGTWENDLKESDYHVRACLAF